MATKTLQWHLARPGAELIHPVISVRKVVQQCISQIGSHKNNNGDRRGDMSLSESSENHVLHFQGLQVLNPQPWERTLNR